MLHLVTENSELKGRRFPMGTNLKRHLESVMANYDGNKEVEGYKRLRNLISMTDSGGVSYEELKRLKNWFDTHQMAQQSAEYQLNGGEEMRMWVEATLSRATKAVKDWKTARKEAGESNAFIRPHEKDRQNKRKQKPTISKVQTSDAGKAMRDGETVKYESRQRTVKINGRQLSLIEAMIRKEIEENNDKTE